MSKYNVNKDGLKDLAIAIVEQAVTDWRFLCNGGTATSTCNFEELTRFFENDCDKYLTGTDISAERILKQMKKEQSEAKFREVSA